MIIRSFITAIELTRRQEKAMVIHCIATRILYNETLSWGKRKHHMSLHGKSWPETGRKLSKIRYNDFDNKFPWMKECSSVIRNAAVEDAQTAMKRFFNKTSDFPRFKNKSAPLKCRFAQPDRISLLCSDGIYSDRIWLPILGTLKLKEKDYLPLQSKIIKPGSTKETTNLIQVAFSKRAGKWYASVSMYLPDLPEEKRPEGKLGIDVGCRTTAATSDGKMFSLSEKQLARISFLEKKLKRTQQQMSRRLIRGQKVQSKNYYEAKDQAATIHKQLTDIRQDHLHKISKRIVDIAPDKIITEDLTIRNMVKNRKLARTISNAGLAGFKQMILHKAKVRDIKVFKVSRWFLSSLLCSSCRHKKTRKELGSRKIYGCSKCGMEIDRDLNAARNLAAVPEESLTEIS